MPNFECKIGDLLAQARYDAVEDKLVWNAVLYRSGIPIHSLAGCSVLVPKTSPIAQIKDAITVVLAVEVP